jgi:hypothetical protein
MSNEIVETLLFNCDDCGKMFIEADHNCVTYTPRLIVTYKGKK